MKDWFVRVKYGPVRECKDVAGQILLKLHTAGYQDLVMFSHAHKSFIKGPVTETAERQPI